MTQTNITPTPSDAVSTAITGPGISGPGLDPKRRVGTRHVDLGREGELVTWADWFQRSAQALEHFLAATTKNIPDENVRNAVMASARVFRVALQDGRQFAVSGVQTHTARGLCFPGGNDRFNLSEGSHDQQTGKGGCDVITGYTLVGTGPDGRATAVSVPPNQIVSVECVLVPQNGQARALNKPAPDEENTFGFARFAEMKSRPDFTEIDEPAEHAASNQND